MHRHDVAGAMLPSLLPIYGADKKPRLVDRDVVAVGRARGCDIVLEANEVSAVHCIFYRAGDGLRLRDCGSRTSTRVNGAPVKNMPLADGDVVQIGPFSFKIVLPPGALPPPGAVAAPGASAAPVALPVAALAPKDNKKLQRLERSRRRLARLALAMRSKVALLRNGKHAAAGKSTDPKTRDHEARLHQLEGTQLELEQRRAQLVKEREAHAQHVQKVEGELAGRLESCEAEIRGKWNEFQQRCAAEQERLLDEALKAAAASGPSKEEGQLGDRLQELERREAQCRQQELLWTRREKELGDESEQLERQRQDFQQQRNKTVAEQAKARHELDQQRVTLSQTETAIREQKAQLTKMVADLKKLQEDMRKQGPELKGIAHENQQLRQQIAAAEQRLAGAFEQDKVEAVLAENEQIKQQLSEKVKRLSEENETLRVQVRIAGGSSGKELESLRKENEQLRQLLQTQLLKPVAGPEMEALRAENKQLRVLLEELERGLAAPQQASAEVQELQQEVEMLRQLLEEKDKAAQGVQGDAAGEAEAQQAELAQLRDEVIALKQRLGEELPEGVAIPDPEGDLEGYEAELNRYRQQLERDRVKLNKEIEALRQRNSELDEATREMELELSRERAEMARERMRLDRLRDEIKSEMERLQRDGGVRESLASVQRLRDEMRPARR